MGPSCTLLAVAGTLGTACYVALLTLATSDVPTLVRQSPLYSCAWPESETTASTAVHPQRPRIVLYQDADANYAPLLNLTHEHHTRYARRWGYTFRTSVGSKSGYPYPTLSRVWALNEELANLQGQTGRGRRGKAHDWFVYMDADALVYEPRCSIEALLRNRSASASALLVCRDAMGRRAWHVNAGVFVANLRHPLIKPLACTWKRRLHWEAWRRQALPTRLYRRLVLGLSPQPWLSDQRVLQDILAEYGTRYPSLAQIVPDRECTFNTLHSSLIRHVFGARNLASKIEVMRGVIATHGLLGADPLPSLGDQHNLTTGRRSSLGRWRSPGRVAPACLHI